MPVWSVFSEIMRFGMVFSSRGGPSLPALLCAGVVGGVRRPAAAAAAAAGAGEGRRLPPAQLRARGRGRPPPLAAVVPGLATVLGADGPIK